MREFDACQKQQQQQAAPGVNDNHDNNKERHDVVCPSPYFARLLGPDTDDSDILDWIQLPLFVSDLHNRIRAASSHDPHPWPSRHDCRSCWSRGSNDRWQQQYGVERAHGLSLPAVGVHGPRGRRGVARRSPAAAADAAAAATEPTAADIQ